jgi:sulfoquinovosidase
MTSSCAGAPLVRVGLVTVVAAALLGPVLSPSGAQAAPGVVVTDEEVVVHAERGRLVVEREPLLLRFETAEGEAALTSLDEHPTAPRPRAPVPERVPGGSVHLDPPPLEAPLTFVVGEQTLAQYPGTFWSADVLTGVAGGVEHAVTEVTDVVVEGAAATLTAATTDPGRTAQVTVRPDDAGTLAVSLRFDDDEGVAVTGASFASTEDEAFHGFGGRRNATDQRGETFYNWLEEFHQRPDEFEPIEDLPLLDDRYQFPTGSQGAYYVQSLFVSSEPYAFWLERDEVSVWRLASDRDDAWQVHAGAPGLDFTVSPGDPGEAVAALTSITGRNPLPPAWAHGPGVSRAVEPFGGTREQYAEQYSDDVMADLDEIERLDLDFEHFAIEGWALLETHGTLEQVMDRMRDLGIRPVNYYKPFVGGGEQTERPGKLEEAIEGGFLATTMLGTPFLFGSPVDVDGIAGLLDVTNPEAVAWYQDRIVDGLDLGFEGFMQDFGEQTFEDMHFADGSTGREMHNRYPVLYHRLTAEVLDAYVEQHPEREPWFYVRSGYTGRPGSAAYEPTSWGGDNTADWSRASGIGAVIPDLLNRSLGGAYGYATDIGGYIDTFGRPGGELLQRWAELGALLPVNRLHGSPVNGTHMPWEYGEDVVEAYRDTMELNRRARPLIRELWQEARDTGTPIARPLWLHHPEDDRARTEEQQWLLGPEVLVAPVVEQGATSREVYFPAGCWEHPETGDRHEGPAEVEVDAPLGWKPYFASCGTDPFAAAADRAGERPDTPARDGRGDDRGDDDAPGRSDPPPAAGTDEASPPPRGGQRQLPATGGGPGILAGTAMLLGAMLRRPGVHGGRRDPERAQR